VFGLARRLVRGHHRVVELLEEGVVFLSAVLFGEAERLDALDEDFGGVGLGFEDFDDFGEEVFEGHGARVGGLAAAHEFGLDVGWDEFEDLDAGGLQLVAQGLAVGVDGRLRGVVGGCDGHGGEGKAGGDRHDGRVWLLEEVRQQGGGEADGTEEVGGDRGLCVADLGGLGEVFGAHDAGVVDDDVEGGEVGGEFLGEGADAGAVFDVKDRGGHAGVGGDGFVEDLLAAAGNDDFVAEVVECLGEAAADTGAAAGDEDGVAGGFHGGSFSWNDSRMVCICWEVGT
jgi:hypothetical protein